MIVGFLPFRTATNEQWDWSGMSGVSIKSKCWCDIQQNVNLSTAPKRGVESLK